MTLKVEQVDIMDYNCSSTDKGNIIIDESYGTKEPYVLVHGIQPSFEEILYMYLIRALVGQTNTQNKTFEEEETHHRSTFINISTLRNLNLIRELSVIVEPDDDGYIARSVDFPLYAEGDDYTSAIENLKEEIEILYEELKEDDNFSVEWLNYKRFLNSIITPNG